MAGMTNSKRIYVPSNTALLVGHCVEVIQFSDIIVKNDVSRLRAYKIAHPSIRFTDEVLCGHRRTSGLKSFEYPTPEFIAAPFDCWYIDKTDVYVLVHFLFNTSLILNP
jgi:hypothetical protein